MADIPSYDEWMSETAGAFYERRNDLLRALDLAIKNYHLRGRNAVDRAIVGKALAVYVDDHQQRKREDSWKHSIRNKRGALERLMLAFVKGPVPKVPEPSKPPRPMPTPAAPHIRVGCPIAKELLDELHVELHSQFDHMQRTPLQSILGPHKTTLETALVSLATDLNLLYCKVRSALERTRNNYIEAMHSGFDTFEALHKGDAEDISFKLSIASKVFEAMQALPFPLSTIGKVGGAAVGLANVEAYSGNHSAIDVSIPRPDDFKNAVSKAAEQFKEFRTVNVDSKKLSDLAGTKGKFRQCFTNYELSLETFWQKETQSIDDRRKRQKLAAQLVSDCLAKLRIDAEMHMRIITLRDEIDARGKTISAEFDDFTNLDVIDHTQVGIWITVSLIADYAVSGLCGLESGQKITNLTASDLASKRFGQKFAEFLASDDVGLLDLKTGGRKSAEIYEEGRIPWDGHPTHIVAVLLYLDWMKRTLNPFDLFSQTSSVKDFREQSKIYIQRLGKVIQQHHETHWYGHNTVTDAGIAAMAS